MLHACDHPNPSFCELVGSSTFRSDLSSLNACVGGVLSLPPPSIPDFPLFSLGQETSIGDHHSSASSEKSWSLSPFGSNVPVDVPRPPDKRDRGSTVPKWCGICGHSDEFERLAGFFDFVNLGRIISIDLCERVQ